MVVSVNLTIMTLFLWHMTALLLAVLMLWPMGFGRAGAGTMGFWLERVLWLGVSAWILVQLAKVFRGAERPPVPAQAAALDVRFPS